MQAASNPQMLRSRMRLVRRCRLRCSSSGFGERQVSVRGPSASIVTRKQAGSFLPGQELGAADLLATRRFEATLPLGYTRSLGCAVLRQHFAERQV